MSAHKTLGGLGVIALLLGLSVTAASAQISADIIEKYRADLKKQATDEDMKREGGTQPRDWNYQLSDGVTTRQVTFYVDGGTPLYGKMFFPKGFSTRGKWPAVVAGHGINALAIGIEKFAARFAERGFVAMAIDYRGWGQSGGFLYPVDPHEVRWDDRLRFSQHTARMRIVRKRLIPEHQILDIRNAIAYLQGEPGVDRARIGVWGTDMAGGHVMVVAATDSRIKAAVAQVPVIEGRDVPTRAFAPTGELHQAEIRRARTGEGAATDMETRLALAEYHPFWHVDQIPDKLPVLFVIAEKDTKVNNDTNAVAASKLLKGPTSVVTVPGATHDQVSSGGAFDTSANAAAEWFLKHL